MRKDVHDMDSKSLEFRQAKIALIITLILGTILIPFFFLGIFIIIGALISYKHTVIVVNPNYVSVKKGMLTKSHVDIPYTKINSISIERTWGRSYGKVLISTGNDTSKLILANIENVGQLKDEVQKRIDVQLRPTAAAPAGRSRVDDLERLANLKKSGAITAQEYLAEKQKILNS